MILVKYNTNYKRYKPPHFTNYKTEAKDIQNNQNNIKQLMLL